MKRMMALLLAVLMLALAGCGGKEDAAGVSMDVQSVYDSMEAMLPEMLVMDEMTMLNFCGIEADMCVQAVVSVAFDGLRADEIWLIEAKDAASLQQLKDLAASRLERKGEETVTYAPDQYEVVRKAEVITAGNFLAVIVSPDVQSLTDIFNQAAEN